MRLITNVKLVHETNKATLYSGDDVLRLTGCDRELWVPNSQIEKVEKVTTGLYNVILSEQFANKQFANV